MPAPSPAAAADDRSGVLRANLLCFAAMLVWSMGLPAADVLLGPLGPLPLAALRLALAAGVMLPVWAARDGLGSLRRAPWLRGVLVGGAGLGLGAFLMAVGQQATDAVTIAVVAAAMPAVGIALEWIYRLRRLSVRLILGLALSLAGGVLALGSSLGALTLGVGTLAAFGSVVAYTWMSFATIRDFPTLSAIGQTTITLTGAALVLGTAAVAQGVAGGTAPDWAAMTPRLWAALAFYGIIGLALSQTLWIISAAHLGVGIASLHVNASPFYVMALTALLGGGWGWTPALAALIVAAGVLVAQSGPDTRRGTPGPAGRPDRAPAPAHAAPPRG